ncbi:universal stress protein [Natronorubrum texcoconense]|uniref:Nucleotide-binding universal stress protein, UspA family n=1 Tax=Natronorubrum texcoconense TaxID=1095776 RepID=A0A1G8UJU7_9EURY|nr:universal stress protein [Natronorubrum texcoconense]SDJ53465.1 Nucleotide-binding universal stress protein, UspA family [Natronorubrum texcoconense]
MYRILLPIDDIEARARAQVESILENPAADECTVDILYVHSDVSAPDAEWAAGGFSETFAEEMAENAAARQRLPNAVEVAIDVLESGDVDWSLHETTGEPAEAILEFAGEVGSDVIVLGIGTESPVGKVLFGSVAQAVILASDRPVTVVPEDRSES